MVAVPSFKKLKTQKFQKVSRGKKKMGAVQGCGALKAQRKNHGLWKKRLDGKEPPVCLNGRSSGTTRGKMGRVSQAGGIAPLSLNVPMSLSSHFLPYSERGQEIHEQAAHHHRKRQKRIDRGGKINPIRRVQYREIGDGVFSASGGKSSVDPRF